MVTALLVLCLNSNKIPCPKARRFQTRWTKLDQLNDNCFIGNEVTM